MPFHEVSVTRQRVTWESAPAVSTPSWPVSGTPPVLPTPRTFTRDTGLSSPSVVAPERPVVSARQPVIGLRASRVTNAWWPASRTRQRVIGLSGARV